VAPATLDSRRLEYLAAANSDGDIRTVRKVLSGRRVKGPIDNRIRQALLAMGITPPNPTSEAR